MSVCQVRPEYEGTSTRVVHPHSGRVRKYKLEADSQPSGHGSATLVAEVRVCEAHRDLFFDAGKPGSDSWQHSNIRLTWMPL